MQITLPRVRRSVAAIGIAVATLVTALPAITSPLVAEAAQSDYYLKLDGIDGESASGAHPGTIQIESWSWGMSNAGSASMGGGMGSGKVSYSDLSIMHHVGKASPKLFEACAGGKHIPNAELFTQTQTRPPAGKTVTDTYRIRMQDVVCTSLQQTGTGSDFPTESVSFTYAKIEVSYYDQASKTWNTAGWDIAANKKI